MLTVQQSFHSSTPRTVSFEKSLFIYSDTPFCESNLVSLESTDLVSTPQTLSSWFVEYTSTSLVVTLCNALISMYIYVCRQILNMRDYLPLKALMYVYESFENCQNQMKVLKPVKSRCTK